MFQDCFEEWITEAVVLAPGEAIWFFRWQLLKEGLPLGDTRDFGFHSGSPVNWARREAQVETMVSTVQEGHHTITKKRTKARGSECPQGIMKTNWAPAAAYNIEEWMQGLEEDASEVEVRNSKVSNWGTDWRNTCSQCVDKSRRQHRRQGAPQLPRDTSSGSPSSGGGSSNWGNEQSSHQSTMTRESRKSSQAGRAGRGLKVKVNLLIFKDEKTKDAVTYHSWQWDIAIFHCLGCDDQHLLPYIFWSLQGFPGNLARNLGEDATLTDILQMLDEHYGMVMTFDTFARRSIPSSKVPGRIWPSAKFGVCLAQQVQILQSEYPGRIQQEHVEEMKQDHFYEGLNPDYQCMLAHKVDGKHPTSYSDLLLASQKLEKWAEARDPLLPKTTTLGGLNATWPQMSGNLFPSMKLKGNCTFMAWSVTVESIGTEGTWV